MYGGDGLARLEADDKGPGKTVFVPFVLPGEIVDANLIEQKKSFARARLNSVLQPSPHRIKPSCPYFQRCGGCQYQHMTYQQQLETKASILNENLRRLARIDLPVELKIHPSPPWNYRNRTRLKIQTQPEFALGYYKMDSHELLAVAECPISSPLINRTIAALWEFGKAGRFVKEALEIEIAANAEDSQLLLELYCAQDATRSNLRQCAEDLKTAMPEISGAVVFKASTASHSPAEPKSTVTVGSPELNYNVGPHSYRVSAGSFFQVNRHLIGEMIDTVIRDAKGATALDLYAGAGLFSTALAAGFAQVIAVEPSPISFADLAYNSPANVKPVRATTDQFLRSPASKLNPDLVVVDPPRNGLGDAVVRGLLNLNAPRLTYVSCDPATLSRDLAGLLQAGYRIEQAHLLDLFPQTFHLESIFNLAR